MKGRYLITTDQWFLAPDGAEYRGVWGEVKILPDDYLGVKTNRNATNWYVKVDTEDNHLIIAGCQIHYAIKSETKPNIKGCPNYVMDSSNYNEELTPNRIYIAE